MQGLIAALVVFPLAHWIPVTPVHLADRLVAPAHGAADRVGARAPRSVSSIGTRADPRQVPLIFGLVVIPITFLGATYYPWAALTPIPWLKVARAA